MDKKKLMKKYMEETGAEDSGGGGGGKSEDPFYSSSWSDSAKRKASENLSDSDDASSPVKKKFEYQAPAPSTTSYQNRLAAPRSFDASLSTINDTINAFKAEAETLQGSVGKEREDASGMWRESFCPL